MGAEIDGGCRSCPRACGAHRDAGEKGLCGGGLLPRVARAALHHWEEPCISGTRGSGTVFFSGCSLRCVFCQNYEISTLGKGVEVSVQRLRDIFSELRDAGAHNINLVNPTHDSAAIAQALEKPVGIPVVYNSGGYESVEALRRLAGKIDIYLPDMKYADDRLAARYSAAPDYFERAADAIVEMYRQTGDYVFDADGLLQRGVLIRHLVLPNAVDNSKAVLQWIDRQFLPGEVLVSLMGQYTPLGRAVEFPELNRSLTQAEYDEVLAELASRRICAGYVQQLDSASAAYVPNFDFTGIVS